MPGTAQADFLDLGRAHYDLSKVNKRARAKRIVDLLRNRVADCELLEWPALTASWMTTLALVEANFRARGLLTGAP